MPETPLRIVLDARKVNDFGIGTYIRNLVAGLADIDQTDRFILVVDPKVREGLDQLPPNFERVVYEAVA